MKKPSLPKRKKKESIPTRITNETVAEHRERILAGGRRFKYPMQYARHRLVLNAIILSVATVIIFAVIAWQQLYFAHNTTDFFYRVTRFIPTPVASVDGQFVRYSDYLMYYNGPAFYLKRNEQVDFSTPDGKAQMNRIKREALNNAESDAYAAKLARQYNLSVSNKEIDTVIDQDRVSLGNISEEVYKTSALTILGWTAGENRHATHNKLLRFKVEYAIDTAANKLQQTIATTLQKDAAIDLTKLSEGINQTNPAATQVGTSGMVPYNNSDGGLSEAAAKLQKGQASGVVKSGSGDGYYFVRLLDKTDTQLNYTYIHVPLSEFDKQFAALKKAKKINEYIKVPAEATTTQSAQ